MRLGIIGGGFGVNGHLAAFSSLRHVEVKAVADSGSGRVLARLQDPSIYFSSWRDLLSTTVDAICVVSPPATHLDIVLAGLGSGKHVLCEKPLGISPTESLQMTNAAARVNLVAATGFQFRYEPGLRALRGFLADGLVGDVESLGCVWLTSGQHDPSSPWTWRNDAMQGGGVIGAFLSHVVDLLHWLTARKVEWVEASTEVIVPQRSRGDGTLMEVTAEDSVRARLGLTGGLWAKCHVSNCHPESFGMRITVRGSSGTLVYSHLPPFMAETQRVHLHLDGEAPKLLYSASDCKGSGDPEDTRLQALRGLIQCFARSTTSQNCSNLPTFEDGFIAQRVLDAVRRSAASECRVWC